jgi:hypothetical protein
MSAFSDICPLTFRSAKWLRERRKLMEGKVEKESEIFQELIESLVAISVVSKCLAKKVIKLNQERKEEMKND